MFAADGTVRYIAARPLLGPHLGYDTHRELALQRVDEFKSYVEALDDQDPLSIWCSRAQYARRMADRATFAAAHRALPTWRR